MRKDFIFDIETIGQNVFRCPIVDVAYTTFVWERFCDDPYTFEELKEQVRVDKLDVSCQVKNGCSFKKQDLSWWERQSDEARNKIKPSSEDLTNEEFSVRLFQYLREQGKIEYWWSRGNAFDPVLLERVMRELDKKLLLDEYLRWWRIRDTRTWIDAKFNFSNKNGFIPVSDVDYWEKNFVGHNSKHDVAADVLRLQTICRAENDLEQTKR